MTERLRVSPLCAIVDVDAAERAGWAPVDLASAFLKGGAAFLQIRAKNADSARFLDIAWRIVDAARSHRATVIVNDRADIARLAHADGVHVGQEDLSPAAVRRVIGDRAVVGLSTHSAAQIDAAVVEPIDYVAIGPVYGTSTKPTGYDAIGLDMVRDAARRAGAAGLPLVAIGGITLDRARDVIDAGAASVAVIGDLVSTADPERRAREFVERLTRS